MTHFFNDLDTLSHRLEGRQVILFLDYDGTLTPIVERPELAVLSMPTRQALEELAQNKHFHLFIVSGRSRADLKQLVGINNIVYIGNHGLEMEGAGLDFKDFSFSRFREILDFLKWEINRELVFFKGAFVEDKGLGLSVHYRALNSKEEPIFETFLKVITREFFSKKEIRITSAKKVLEIRAPLDWDKGKAVALVLKKYQATRGRQKVFPVYLGDDTTDEDAFLALKGTGMTVYVGHPKHSNAHYYLNDATEVTEFLEYCVSKVR